MIQQLVDPSNMSPELLDSLTSFIFSGGQVEKHGLRERIRRSKFAAFYQDESSIVSTVVVKNPQDSYKNRVFRSAKVSNPELYKFEIGYLVTRKEYEGRKLCQQLLDIILPHINISKTFATTQNLAVVHILGKHGFKVTGERYKDGLHLLLGLGRHP